MANGYGFQSYPEGPTPDPKRVGQILAEKAAMRAASGGDSYGDDGSDDSDTAPLMSGAPSGGPGFGNDLLGAVAQQVDAYASSDRGTLTQGRLVATGGDGSGTPGVETPPPPLSAMATQSSSNMTARPETQTVDGDYDPAVEHSASATAAALGDAQRRTTGGASGKGKVQNPSPATPLQGYQFQRMGLSPAEIAFFQQGGAIKGG